MDLTDNGTLGEWRPAVIAHNYALQLAVVADSRVAPYLQSDQAGYYSYIFSADTPCRSRKDCSALGSETSRLYKTLLVAASSAPACARALPTVCSGPVTTPGRTTLHLRLFRASGASSLRLALAAIAEATSLHLGMAALLELVGPPSLRLTLAVLRAAWRAVGGSCSFW